ncbi:hypothetical protein AB8A05_04280 [Tardiphaga sp. 538_B7_N1_4]|uniref:hypothetical protein n=1 Tax=Tardiphaga sp. 538_B7_N1_4 TaxID=3240778 RepID=UPI003F2731BE
MPMTKTIDESFIDWESSAFGFGYGTGEEHVLGALKAFFAAFGDHENPNAYDYEKLETAVTPTVAWLLINRLCKHDVDIIEYGTSPRFGWLTENGIALKAFVDSKSVGDLETLVCSTTEDSTICYPDACNCGPNGYQEGVVCQNPFWPKRR